VFRNLTSRLLAMALMIALLAKPCLGLLADSLSGDHLLAGNRIGIATEASQKPVSCNRVCLNARIEEVHASVIPVKAKLAGPPASVVSGAAASFPPYLGYTPPREAEAGNVRTRLAMLSRLLL
jgi:hypothetical protein